MLGSIHAPSDPGGLLQDPSSSLIQQGSYSALVLLPIPVFSNLTRNGCDYERIHVFEYLFNCHACCFL